MTINDAIDHAKDVADKKYKEGFLCYANSGVVENDKKNDECVECAKEHEQLAEWLEELQKYRAIGTAEECREAVERRIARKPEKELRDLENNPEIDCYGINELNNACARAADAPVHPYAI